MSTEATLRKIAWLPTIVGVCPLPFHGLASRVELHVLVGEW
jgi:hypothetical protein